MTAFVIDPSNMSTNLEAKRPPRTMAEILPPYSVILHSDDAHSMDIVAAALMKSVPNASR